VFWLSLVDFRAKIVSLKPRSALWVLQTLLVQKSSCVLELAIMLDVSAAISLFISFASMWLMSVVYLREPCISFSLLGFLCV
jgi:hypothetical protein